MPRRTAFQQWLALPDVPSNPVIEPTDPRLSVLVVGAGPAGLAGMSALGRRGIEFTGVESHSRVGGIWDASNPASSIYEGMRTVTSRYTTHLGPPMPDDWPDYVPHEQAREYLTRFAGDEELTSRIRFDTTFEGATKSPSGAWSVQLRQVSDGRRYEENFRAIVFATGAHNRATSAFPTALREQAISSGIRVIHSAEYENPSSFAGQRVLIVGIGNSGSDIAVKISSAASRTLIAVRTSPWINPQTVFGVPCDKLTADTPGWIPKWWQVGSFHVIRWLTVGGFRRLGLSLPKQGLNDRLPIGDRGIVDAIRRGRVVVRSTVTGFNEGLASFEDPSHPAEPIDAVIFATGYTRHYPLACEPGASVDDVARALPFFIFHRREPGLAYLAETIGLRGCWPVFVEQAGAIASYFVAEQQGTANVRRFNARRTLPSPDFKGALFHGADRFHVDYNVYERALRDLSAWLAD
jgi:Flavin-binding monooxygenase-like